MAGISGFPEFLPNEQIVFDRIVGIIKSKFELYGFVPLDTPAVERVSTLLAKGNDSEIYGIHRLADEGGSKKDLALRFDLTVPLARYVAQHYGRLIFPYRRYHIGPVWRGERAQAGRYRQFYQCDIDIIGDGELSIYHDAEIIGVIYDVLSAIIPTDKFLIKINSRKVLSGLIKSFGVAEQGVAGVMRIIDKVEKVARDVIRSELQLSGISDENIASLFMLLDLDGSNEECLAYLCTIPSSEELTLGIEELKSTTQHIKSFGVPGSAVKVDPCLARGLTYYTGIVYEVQLPSFPELGSICGGGRYDDLSGVFCGKKLPGVGASVGISRLIPRLIAAGMYNTDSSTIARVLVTSQDKSMMSRYIALSNLLRGLGINTEIYLQDRHLGAQMKYADKKGFAFVIVADAHELERGEVGVRNMGSGEQSIVPMHDIAAFISANSA